MHAQARLLIDELRLRPHPEGGYFTESYRSAIEIDAPAGRRSALTSIYYLLEGDVFSAFHRLTSDEIWHHYLGSPVTIEIIDAGGEHRQVVVGEGRCRQAAVAARAWFAAHLRDPDAYALLGCDVAPGFEYGDFEIGARNELVTTFPQHRVLIERWTRPL